MYDDPESTIRATWAELAGCAEAFRDAGVRVSVGEHAIAPDGWVGTVRLGDSAVVAIRPDDAVSRERLSNGAVQLGDIIDVASASAAFGPIGDTLGPAILAFGLTQIASEPDDSPRIVGPVPAADPRVRAIVAASSLHEVEESAVGELSSGLWIALDGDANAAAACGYSPVCEALAHIGVLTSGHARGRGFGRAAASAAIVNAQRAGLIPQWRAAVTNCASIALAARLGLTDMGRQFSFRLASIN